MRPSPPSGAPTAWLARSVAAAGDLLQARRPRTPLPRPTLSVGNLAFGGRGKTPLVAALAACAASEGLRCAVLTRGAGRRGSAPRVVRCDQPAGRSWQSTVSVDGVPMSAARAARLAGEEPVWLATQLAGMPVAVHADRRVAAGRLDLGAIDLFLLDDGFSAAVERDLDLVLVREDDVAGAWLRESPHALDRADLVVRLGADGLHRRLRDVVALVGEAPPPVDAVAVCGVGDPGSVVRLAAQAGIRVAARPFVFDHRAPGPGLRARFARQPWLVTEKDALRWAAERPPPGGAWVLRQDLAGVDALWASLRPRLPARMRP